MSGEKVVSTFAAIAGRSVERKIETAPRTATRLYWPVTPEHKPIRYAPFLAPIRATKRATWRRFKKRKAAEHKGFGGAQLSRWLPGPDSNPFCRD